MSVYVGVFGGVFLYVFDMVWVGLSVTLGANFDAVSLVVTDVDVVTNSERVGPV